MVLTRGAVEFILAHALYGEAFAANLAEGLTAAGAARASGTWRRTESRRRDSLRRAFRSAMKAMPPHLMEQVLEANGLV